MLRLKNILFTILVPGTVAVLGLLLMAGKHSPASGGVLGPAVVLLAFGSGIYAWCVWDFASFGRGTPAPIDPPERLVIRGLYRVTRNPMYVGVLTIIVGWTLLFQSVSLIV